MFCLRQCYGDGKKGLEKEREKAEGGRWRGNQGREKTDVWREGNYLSHALSGVSVARASLISFQTKQDSLRRDEIKAGRRKTETKRTAVAE